MMKAESKGMEKIRDSDSSEGQKILIDIFAVPELAREEFLQRSRDNRLFLRTLPGFVQDFIFEKSGGPGRYNFVTLAVWKNAVALDAARIAVSAQYAKTGLNLIETLKRLGIEMDRAQYIQIETGPF
jgi:hypothetical protein